MLDELRIQLVLFNPPDESGYESINDVWEVTRNQSPWLLGVDGVASTAAEAGQRLECLIETSEGVWEKANVTMAIPPRCRKLQPTVDGMKLERWARDIMAKAEETIIKMTISKDRRKDAYWATVYADEIDILEAMWDSMLSHPEWKALNLNIDRGRTGFYLMFSMAESEDHTVELIKEDMLDMMKGDDSPYGKVISFDNGGDQFSVTIKLKVTAEVLAAHIREDVLAMTPTAADVKAALEGFRNRMRVLEKGVDKHSKYQDYWDDPYEEFSVEWRFQLRWMRSYCKESANAHALSILGMSERNDNAFVKAAEVFNELEIYTRELDVPPPIHVAVNELWDALTYYIGNHDIEMDKEFPNLLPHYSKEAA